MNKFALALGMGLIGLFVIFLFSLIVALPTMWLWNWLMPDIFGLQTIGFFQAWGVNVLCGIMFKGSPITTKND